MQYYGIMQLDPKLEEHYLSFGIYTYLGLYERKLIDDLPDDIKVIGLLVQQNIIHRTTLAGRNSGSNADLHFGDMTRVPW